MTDMQDKSFGWCFIGSGAITRRVLKDMHRTKGGCLAAVYSLDGEGARQLARDFEATAYDTLEEALSDPRVEAAYVAVPHTAHKEMTLRALAAGRPVLCEKPFSVSLADTGEMLSAAREAGLYLAEGLWTRHNPAVKQALSWIAEGKIGEVRSLTASFSTRQDFDPASRLFRPDLAGGSLYDVGVYAVAMAQFVFERAPERISAMADFAPSGVDHMCAITLGYKGGGIARLFSGLHVDEPQDAVIFGERGRILLSCFWAPDRAELIAGEERTVFETNKQGEGYHFEFDAVMEEIRSGRLQSRLVPHSLTETVAEITEQVRRSIGLEF